MQLPYIANVVASADLGTKINIEKLKEKLHVIKYNPKKFAAGILKINNPIKATFLIWNTGKIICLGTKNLNECEKIIKYIIERIKNSGFSEVNYSGYKIQNIVSTFDSGNRINLGEFSIKYRRECFYEPEYFCGLHFKVHPRITVLIFYTGKIIITGAKDLKERDFMYKKLKRYLL